MVKENVGLSAAVMDWICKCTQRQRPWKNGWVSQWTCEGKIWPQTCPVLTTREIFVLYPFGNACEF